MPLPRKKRNKRSVTPLRTMSLSTQTSRSETAAPPNTPEHVATQTQSESRNVAVQTTGTSSNEAERSEGGEQQAEDATNTNPQGVSTRSTNQRVQHINVKRQPIDFSEEDNDSGEDADVSETTKTTSDVTLSCAYVSTDENTADAVAESRNESTGDASGQAERTGDATVDTANAAPANPGVHTAGDARKSIFSAITPSDSVKSGLKATAIFILGMVFFVSIIYFLYFVIAKLRPEKYD